MPENDLFESFTTMTQTDLHPLPASEVRRRGDRLRRRNTALAVAGGTVAAMTAIGVPVALSQDGTDARPDPGLYASDRKAFDRATANAARARALLAAAEEEWLDLEAKREALAG